MSARKKPNHGQTSDRWHKPHGETGGHTGPPLRRVSIRRRKPNQRDNHKIKIRTVQYRSKKIRFQPKIPNRKNTKNHGQTNINRDYLPCRGRPMCLPAPVRGGWVFWGRWHEPHGETAIDGTSHASRRADTQVRPYGASALDGASQTKETSTKSRFARSNIDLKKS